MTVRFDPTKELPSPGLCEKLEELGYPQDGGGWYWYANIKNPNYRLVFWKEFECDFDGSVEAYVKAPTVRELGEWLPNEFCSGRIMDYLCENMKLDPTAKDKYPIMHADTEANARAKMLIWLAENGYVKFKEGVKQ